ncbi:unnamed protein product [Haemonchus placei]|uniref:RRM domain-containing protein n=1 Tax=Haemonchus placei TaxID=6290 RepID=A0A0N4X8E9_HAEPC|nr:unnamed protein product [Haemonchus placei]
MVKTVTCDVKEEEPDWTSSAPVIQVKTEEIDQPEAAVGEVIAARPHVINGKTVNLEGAMSTDSKDRDTSYVSTKSLYVSGVREDHTEQMFTEYFRMYGDVVKAQKPRDRVYGMGRSRGDAAGGWPGGWGEQVCGCYGQQGGYGEFCC